MGPGSSVLKNEGGPWPHQVYRGLWEKDSPPWVTMCLPHQCTGLGEGQDLNDHFPQLRPWLLLYLLPSLAPHRKTTAPHGQICLPQFYPSC